MATREATAIRQQLAAERIAKAIGVQLPFVKGPSEVRHAAHLEIIANHLDPQEQVEGSTTERTEDHGRENTGNEGAATPRADDPQHPRVQRQRKRG